MGAGVMKGVKPIAIPIVDVIFPGVWEIMKTVKAIMPIHAMIAPQYADLRDFDFRSKQCARNRSVKKT